MTVPKTIESHARNYVKTKSKSSYIKVVNWIIKQNELDISDIGKISIVDKPKGDKQFEDGEFCYQWSIGYDGDSFQGYYYHKMRENDDYLKYEYEC